MPGALRAVWGFSSFQMAHGFASYFSRNMDNLLVGAAFGGVALGYYDGVGLIWPRGG